jgi:hypothetical protein
MKAKFILDVGELLHMPLLIAFNYFLTENFLEAFSTGVVHTLFKRGDAFEFENYVRITVGLILAKLFIVNLDKRLSEWAEQHGLHAKGQAGFCKGYYIIDQLFILRTLIKQSKAKKKPLYCCFVDFKKAFDMCRVKCCGKCWLALRWRDASYDACRRCMPRIPYASTTQVRVLPRASGVNKV